MKNRTPWLILLPAVSVALFLIQLFRTHGYEHAAPAVWAVLGWMIVAVVALLCRLESRWLGRRLGLDGASAPLAALAGYLPLSLLLLYFLPPVRAIRNMGTMLSFAALCLCLAARGVLMLRRYRVQLTAALSRSYTPLLLITGLALLLRVSVIAADRFHGDEALYAHWGLLIATGKDIFLKTEVVDKPPLLLYVLALSFRLFGHTEVAARLPNVIASTTGIVLLYHIGLRLYDRRTATLAALLLALAPFDIQFAPTAFTDPLMVLCVLAAWLAVLDDGYARAGLFWGLALATKPTAVAFGPLLLAAAVLRLRRAPVDRRRAAARSAAMALGAVLFALVVWDGVIRVGQINVLTASALHYGGLGVAPLRDVLPRLAGWLGQLYYMTGSRALNAIAVAGVPLLLSYDVIAGPEREGAAYDGLLVGFGLLFLLVHSLLTFSIWDRYLLGLAPLGALVLARVLLLRHDVLRAARATRERVYIPAMGLVLGLLFLAPTNVALHYGYPIGSNQGFFTGAFQGIEEVANYFRTVSPGSIVFHRWLGWHYSFYLFGAPLDFYYWETPEGFLELAQTSDVPKYVVFPDWASSEELWEHLRANGWYLEEVYHTYRVDGTQSFTVYRVFGPDDR